MAPKTPYLLFLLVAILVICKFAKSACPSEEKEPWSYNKWLKNGPQRWGETYPSCYGRRQSPIEIVAKDAVRDINLKKLQLTNYSKPVTKAVFENNGHTLKVTPIDGIVRSVLINGTSFNLAQLHFHWGDVYFRGSEHKVDGTHYAAELHFVHLDTRGRIAVVAILLQDSVFNNSGFQPIGKLLPSLIHKGTKLNATDSIPLDKLVQNGCSYYRYNGSLTTPGCDEGVTWTICKEPIKLGYFQLKELRKLSSVEKPSGKEISGCEITGNYRPIQPLNGRIIRSSV